MNHIHRDESHSPKIVDDHYEHHRNSDPENVHLTRPPVHAFRRLVYDNEVKRTDLEEQARAVYPLYREIHKPEALKDMEKDFDHFYRYEFPKLLQRANNLLKNEAIGNVNPNSVSDSNPRVDADTTELKSAKDGDLISMGISNTTSANDYKKSHMNKRKSEYVAEKGSAKTNYTKRNGNNMSNPKKLQGQSSGGSIDKEEISASLGSKSTGSTSVVQENLGKTRKKSAARKDAGMKTTVPLVNTALDRTGTKALADNLSFPQDRENSYEPGTLDATTTALSANGVASGILQVKKTGSTVNVTSKLSFSTKIYTPELAGKVASLRDNTKNIQTVVQSTQGNQAVFSSGGNRLLLQGPVVVTGLEEPQGRRLLSGISDFSMFFCDVTGNAVWKWDRESYHSDLRVNMQPPIDYMNSTVDKDSDICTDASVTVTVSAYQSGCSRQNHPQGCEYVYHKGCGGLSINPITNRVVVARTGGRTIGTMSFKMVGNLCQGRIVDAITHFRGRKFNSPSNAEYTSTGVLYFTDSPFGFAESFSDLDSDSLDRNPLREIPFNGVYWLQNVSNASVALADCSMDRPNKIAFSPKEDILYITNSRRGNSYVKAFNINSDGSVGRSRIFFNFSAHSELDTDEGYAEGIKVDSSGNVYVVAYKAVHIFASNGTIIGVISSSQRINDLVLGNGQIFITGEFGIVAQLGDVKPATPIRQMALGC